MNCCVEHKLRLLSDAKTFFDCFSFLWFFFGLEIAMKANDGKKILILHTELNVDLELRLLSDAFVDLY